MVCGGGVVGAGRGGGWGHPQREAERCFTGGQAGALSALQANAMKHKKRERGKKTSPANVNASRELRRLHKLSY